MKPSKRALALSESATLRLFAEVARLRAAGKSVISLLEGEADLPPPPSVVAATAAALRAGHTRYSQSAGLPELREAIAAKLRRENGVPARPEGVVVANGAKQALYQALQALCGPGDEVLVPSPYWVTFPEAARLAGARPVFAAADPESIARAVTRRTRVLILNSPSNPTGAVLSREALRELLALARKKDFFIISDEAYEKLVFDGREHVSPASLGADAFRRVVTVQTCSKSFSMTGFRVGWAAAEPGLARLIARIQGQLSGNVCTFAQHGALAALALPASYHEKRRETFERRRDLAMALAMPLFPFVDPQGGFFLWMDARPYHHSSAALCQRLLKKGVAVVPGSACGQEGWLRLTFSKSEADIREGFARISAALP